MTVTPIALPAPAPQPTGSRKASSGGDFARHLDAASRDAAPAHDARPREEAEVVGHPGDAPSPEAEGAESGGDGMLGLQPESAGLIETEENIPTPVVEGQVPPPSTEADDTSDGASATDAERTPTVEPTAGPVPGERIAPAVVPPPADGDAVPSTAVPATPAANPATASAVPTVPAPAHPSGDASAHVPTADADLPAVLQTATRQPVETTELEPPAAASASPRASTTQDSAVAMMVTTATQGTAPAGPASAPAAHAAPASAAPLPQQIAPHLSQLRALPDGEHVLTVTVDPEHFGPVKVVAHITPDSATVHLVSPTDAGREALRGALADLRRDLAATGLQAQLDVGTGSGSGSGQRDGTPTRDAPAMPGSVPTATTALNGDVSTRPSTAGASGTAGIDLIL